MTVFLKNNDGIRFENTKTYDKNNMFNLKNN